MTVDANALEDEAKALEEKAKALLEGEAKDSPHVRAALRSIQSFAARVADILGGALEARRAAEAAAARWGDAMAPAPPAAPPAAPRPPAGDTVPAPRPPAGDTVPAPRPPAGDTVPAGRQEAMNV